MSVILLRRFRRTSQILFLLICFLLPIFDLFRLDIAQSRFVIAGKFFFINQLYLALILFILSLLLLTLTARNFGRIFCGWFCFQTIWSELGSAIVGRWQNWRKGRGKPSSSPKPIIEMVLLLLVVIPLMLGFYSMLVCYFVDPKVVWTYFQFGPPMWFIVLFAKFSTFGLLDLLVIRHSFCQTMCPYGILQQKAKKNKTLRVAFDPSTCIDCSLCDKACPMKLKPRELKIQDPCISCFECSVACGLKAEKLAAKGVEKGSVNSLTLQMLAMDSQQKAESFMDSKTWMFAGGAVLFLALLITGIWLDKGIDLSIHQGKADSAFQLKVVNRKDTAVQLHLDIQTQSTGGGAERYLTDVTFAIQPDFIQIDALHAWEQAIQIQPVQPLESGRYPLLIRLLNAEGEEVESTKTVYYQK